MTLPRFEAICGHWKRVPPIAVTTALIAQSLGAWKPDAPPPKAAPTQGDLQGLVDMLGGAGFSREKPEWLREATK